MISKSDQGSEWGLAPNKMTPPPKKKIFKAPKQFIDAGLPKPFA